MPELYTDPVGLAQGVLTTFAPIEDAKHRACDDCGRAIAWEWYEYAKSVLLNAALVDGKLLCPTSYAKKAAGDALRARLASR